jgi:hypothetical protein
MPSVHWLYGGLNPAFVDKEMTAEEYVTEMSGQHGLGDTRSKTTFVQNIVSATTDILQSLHNTFWEM